MARCYMSTFSPVKDCRSPGAHVLKIWMITPGVVLQRIVIDAGGVRESYLGPPESVRWNDVRMR
jgi:hypothetical protein